MNILNKLQNLPEKQRKVILWSAIMIVAIFLLALYVQNVNNRIKSFQEEKLKEELQLQKLKEDLGNLPKIEIFEHK